MASANVFRMLTLPSMSFDLPKTCQVTCTGFGARSQSVTPCDAAFRESAALISYADITPLIPAAAIGLLTVAVNFVVDWILHMSSGLRDDERRRL